LVILFEDHTAQQFRPLSWSLPVYEIPCGLFNLRERVQLLRTAEQDSFEIALLPRGLLTDLQREFSPPGIRVGLEACREAATGDVLFLAARVAPQWSTLRDLLRDLPVGEAQNDAHGLVAWHTTADDALAALASWHLWDEACAGSEVWTAPVAPAPVWSPVSVAPDDTAAALGYLWHLIDGIGGAVRDDTAALAEGVELSLPPRHLFGALPAAGEPTWAEGGVLVRADDSPPEGVSFTAPEDSLQEDGTVREPGELWLGEGCVLDPGVVINVSNGPVVIDRGTRVLPHTYLEGPLYLGCDVRVKAGATLYGETAVGAGCRVAGEIAESQLLPYMNKQHAGFLGHSIVGSWVNLGADTTNSDLKNNYSKIKVNYGLGPLDSGSRFVGLMMGEHAKSAIGTTFNTGTTVGFASNVFAAGFPRTYLCNFTWGDGRGRRIYEVARALDVARIVMSRRDCRFTTAQAALFRSLAGALIPTTGS